MDAVSTILGRRQRGLDINLPVLDWLESFVKSDWPTPKECPPPTTLIAAYVFCLAKAGSLRGEALDDTIRKGKRVQEARGLIVLDRDPETEPGTWLKVVKEAFEGSYPSDLPVPRLAEVDLWLLEQTFRIFMTKRSFFGVYRCQCSSLIAQRSIFLITLFSKELPHPSHLIRSITILFNCLDLEGRICTNEIKPVLEDLLGFLQGPETLGDDQDAVIMKIQSTCLKMRTPLLYILDTNDEPRRWHREKFSELRLKFEAAFDRMEVALTRHRDKLPANQAAPVNLNIDPADPRTAIVEVAEGECTVNPKPAVSPDVDAHTPIPSFAPEYGDF